jgi:hypothetical protein
MKDDSPRFERKGLAPLIRAACLADDGTDFREEAESI